MVRVQPCDLCGLRGQAVTVFHCALYGECSLHRQHSQIRSCLACADRTIQWRRDTDVAPLAQRGARPWEGCQPRKAWEHGVTVMIPVHEPGPSLETVIELLRQQTWKPYIVLVDTGSRPESLLKLWERFDTAEDVEIHAVRGHGYRSSSEPVSTAIDVGIAICQTPWLFLTHDDLFVRRRDLLEWLHWLSERYETPVVGWQMSDRTHVCGDRWKGMVSHTCTLLHLPRLEGLTWSLRRAHAEFGLPRTHASWPDTETGFNLLLHSHGIKPLLLGEEFNYVRQTTRWWDHCRSYTGSGLYHEQHRLQAKTWMQDALEQARERLATWSRYG